MTDIGREKERIRVEPNRREAPIPTERPAPRREREHTEEGEERTAEPATT